MAKNFKSKYIKKIICVASVIYLFALFFWFLIFDGLLGKVPFYNFINIILGYLSKLTLLAMPVVYTIYLRKKIPELKRRNLLFISFFTILLTLLYLLVFSFFLPTLDGVSFWFQLRLITFSPIVLGIVVLISYITDIIYDGHSFFR